MKTRMIYPALLLSVCVLFSQCRAKSDVSSVQNVAGAVDVAAVDTVAAEKDTPVVVASVPEDTVAVAPVPEVQAVNPVPQGEPHPGFVYLRSLIPDLIEELRYFTTNNFMGVKVDGYEANLAILSKEAATALASAADELREKGYVIKIFDAYRPQKAVDHFVRWSKTDDQRNKADYYPSLSKKSLFPTYVARRSGHSRGSTIDMTICYKDTKKEVDMGGHFDYFGPPSHPTFTGKYPGGEVTEEHKQRRMMLREVMVRHGFNPYDSEWWHFTLKNEPYPKTYFEFVVK